MLCFVPATGLALGTLPPERVPDASGLYSLMRNLGGAVGLAWISTAMQQRGALHGSRLAERLDAYSPAVQERVAAMAAAFADAGLPDPDRAALLHRSDAVRRQADIMALDDLMLLLAGCVCLALLLLPFVRRAGAASEMC
jgi:DHA2 family multidrug resistance protein